MYDESDVECLCFKAYATREVDIIECTLDHVPLYWVHPREVHTNEFSALMNGIHEIAVDEANEKGIRYDWITVVAYDIEGTAQCAYDYGRTYYVLKWHDEEISDEIAQL